MFAKIFYSKVFTRSIYEKPYRKKDLMPVKKKNVQDYLDIKVMWVP